MGILKHFVLPGFALVHAASIVACKDLISWAGMVCVNEDDKVNESDDISIRQNHMLGCLRGFNVGMLILCGFGTLSNNASSDMRQAVALAETALFSVVAVDAFRGGLKKFWVPVGHAVVTLGGLIVSVLEPGIFTKDHNK